jgi:predicted Fe-Mo cluster-binding NifX family protein
MNMMNRVAGTLIWKTQIKDNQMKIAVITDDGKTISQHFGRAKAYVVATIEDGKITNREMRSKLGHNQFAGEPHEEHHGESHGQDPASHNKHVQMANAIADCQVLLCGGMGMGAYLSMQQLNIQPIVTDYQDVEGAVQAYIDGKIEDHTEKLH